VPSIERVDLYRLRVPLTTPYRLSFGPLDAFDTIIVQALDSEGRCGLGEATLLPGYSDETVGSSWQLALQLAARFPGESLERCRVQCADRVAGAPFTATAVGTALEMLARSPWLDTTSAARVPLLGLVNGTGATELETEVDELLAQGFRTLKVKVGFDAAKDAAKVKLIQGIVRGRAGIRIDANQGFDARQGCEFALALEPEGIELFEQPCAAGDWDAARAVARVSPVPMMLDESIYGTKDIETAAELGAARYIKLKLMKLGGLDPLARAIARIRELGMEPVLGNGVACEIGCWMEACVARSLISNAGEMNGFLKPTTRLLANPLRFDAGAVVLEVGYQPRLDPAAVSRHVVEQAQFH
jgi:L-Ala-D/L-Glu epimerase